ncbi:MAG TPA: biopolymer transporter ExbD [Nitrospirota bacterium]|nr:biopolymer transporter ExbD [Nitrospirota bacterium]
MNEKEFDYINVIPLVDVMLVLLTIVLTTSTFIATGAVRVELPQASKSPAEILKTQTIEIDVSGNIYLNSRLTALDELKISLQTTPRETPLLIRADKNIRLQAFVDVLDVVKNLAFKRVSLQTQEMR